MKRPRRMCTVAIGAAIAIFAVAVPAATGSASTSSASACTATAGVTVIVDFSHFSGGKIERGCASGHPASALAALRAAGFATAGTVQYGDGFVCRIDGLPTPQDDACAVTPPSTAYWAFWHARPSDPTWTYADIGVLDYRPAAGSITAFAFGAHALPGITPAAALPPQPPTTSTATTSPPPTTPPTAAPTVTAGAVVPPSGTAPSASGAPVSTTTAHPRPHRTSTTRAPARPRSPTRSAPRVVERSASGPLPRGNSGSPLPAILTVGVVGALAIGGLLLSRSRRRGAA